MHLYSKWHRDRYSAVCLEPRKTQISPHKFKEANRVKVIMNLAIEGNNCEEELRTDNSIIYLPHPTTFSCLELKKKEDGTQI